MPDSKEVVRSDHLIEQNRVVEYHLKGDNPKQISDRTGIPFARVKRHLSEWQQIAQNHPALRARAKEALVNADEHYQALIREMWQVIREVEDDDASSLSTVARAKVNATKAIADIEKARVDMLHRAGLLENDELAQELAENERKQEILIGILREVTADCDHCRLEVQKRLTEVTNTVEAVRVDYGPQ